MTHCESEDFEGEYDGQADEFTAEVNGQTVACEVSVVGAGRVQVNVSQSFFSNGDTLVILRSGDPVDTIAINDDC